MHLIAGATGYVGGLLADELAARDITPRCMARSPEKAIVIGSGSESLRTIAYLVKRLPAMITPSWTQTKTQPIAAADVVAFLAAAPDVPESSGREIEIGGPDVTTYGGLLDLAAESQGSAPTAAPRRADPLAEPELALDRPDHPGRRGRGAASG